MTHHGHGTRASRRNNGNIVADFTFTQIERNAAAEVLDGDFENQPPDDEAVQAWQEFTQQDPAFADFFADNCNSSSSDKDDEDDDDNEEQEEQEEQQDFQHHQPSSLTQDAASSLLGLFQHGAPSPPQLPAVAPQRPLMVNPYGQSNQRSTVTPPSLPIGGPPSIAALLAGLNPKDLLNQTALSESELAFANGSRRGKNQKKYSDSQDSVERRFFDTLIEYGSNVLAIEPLLRKVTMDYGQGPVEDYAFYQVLQGEKTTDKHKLLAFAMMLPAMKWTCLSGKRKGEPLEPNSFDKTIQKLFYVFDKKGIQYHYKKDFNEPGGFHGLVLDRWNAIRKDDPKFGTHRNKSVMVNNYLELIVEAIRAGKLQPYDSLFICS